MRFELFEEVQKSTPKACFFEGSSLQSLSLEAKKHWSLKVLRLSALLPTLHPKTINLLNSLTNDHMDRNATQLSHFPQYDCKHLS